MTTSTSCFYILLGVDRTATSDEINRAYRSLAHVWHPDRNNGSSEASARLVQLNQARAVLLEAGKRALYDEFSHEGLASGFDAERARAANRRKLDPRRRPTDYLMECVVDAHTMRAGGTVKVKVKRVVACAACRGRGIVHMLCATCRGVAQPERHVECFFCDGKGFDDDFDICCGCDGCGTTLTSVPCAPCGGKGGYIRDCPTCRKQGKVWGIVPLTVTVPAGIQDSQILRVAGRAPRSGGDLFIRIRRAA